MEQKKFLSADEVFQLFGVDADGLQALVDGGAIKPLTDMGSFKYRSEEFAKLVQDGKLTPRTSGEMFLQDSDGDIPFLKLKDTDEKLADADVSFIELDEQALDAEAAQNPHTPKTPVIPENWFENVIPHEPDRVAPDTDDEIDVEKAFPAAFDDKTEYELKIDPPSHAADSDSDVKVFDEDSIDYSEPDVAGSGSDSDVRLEGPLSSAGFSTKVPKSLEESDSDVRLTGKPSDSDSDVRIAAPGGLLAPESDSDVKIAQTAGRPDSDSDVRIAQSAPARESDSDVNFVANVSAAPGAPPRDSDIILTADDVSARKAKTGDSDSDVRIAEEAALLGDISVSSGSALDDDSGIRLDIGDSGIALDNEASDSGITLFSPSALDGDSGITLEPTSGDSGITLVSAKTENDMAVQSDSGITLESGNTDSGIAIIDEDRDSGITLDVGDSGISIEQADSGIMLEGDDSGIQLVDADSGIQLADADSGIQLAGLEGDSGIRLSGDSGQLLTDADMGATLSDADFMTAGDSGQTMTLASDEASDSAFDVNLDDSAHTLEMRSDDLDPAATIVESGNQKKRGKTASLTEAFELDDDVEVEDLDISQHLEEAPESDYEFVEAAEEIMEADDEHFSSGEVEVAEEGESEELATPVRARTGPREPSWGMVAIIPIVLSACVMLLTVPILWGGMMTMWTGAEPPAPAGAIISMLAGLIPS